MKLTITEIQESSISGFECQGECCVYYKPLRGYDENTGYYDEGGCSTENIKECPVFEDLLNEENHNNKDNVWKGCELCKHLETDEESDKFKTTCGNCCHFNNSDDSMFELDYE